jgi:poly-gamma-glutamate capsule biosynthesis protein CapA/YwtB (metallophosphatase superfamily)
MGEDDRTMSATHSLLLAGDMLPVRRFFDAEVTSSLFLEVCERVQAADIAVGTLDLVLTTRGAPAEKLMALRVDPSVASDLREMGFDVLSIATNHAMDYGAVGLADTLDAADRAGIALVGAGSDIDAATAPFTIKSPKGSVAILAWSCLLPTGSSASSERPGVAPLHVHVSYELDSYIQMEEPTYPPTIRSLVADPDIDSARAIVAAVKSATDLVVLLVHWGVGDSEELSEYQQPLAHALVDAGVDLVVGSHPHCVHGIEIYRGRPILYSLGTLIEQIDRQNLPLDLQKFMERTSADSYLATYEAVDGDNYELSILPITRGPDGLPALARGTAFDRIAVQLARLSKQFGTRFKSDADVIKLIPQGRDE